MAYFDHFEAPSDRSQGLEKFSKLIRIRVANNGPKKAEGLEIDFGKGDFIYTVNGGPSQESTKSIALLGDLSYGHSFDVRVWADEKVNDRNFTIGDKHTQAIVPLGREAGPISFTMYVILVMMFGVLVLLVYIAGTMALFLQRWEKVKRVFLKDAEKEIDQAFAEAKAKREAVELESLIGAEGREATNTPPETRGGPRK